MDKKKKQHRQKTASPEDLKDLAPAEEGTPDQSQNTAPPGASFSTQQGRAAQGMRPDLGGDPSVQPTAADPANPMDEMDDEEDKPGANIRAPGSGGRAADGEPENFAAP